MYLEYTCNLYPTIENKNKNKRFLGGQKKSVRVQDRAQISCAKTRIFKYI